MKYSLFQYSPEVAQALEEKKPIVALESTVISHGLPYPDNLETTHAMQTAVLEKNATPAIIALMNGQIKIGLNNNEIEQLATQNKLNQPVLKINRADIAYALTTKQLGSTTVSATAFCAHQAGIKIFATGGIGGVHRGAETSFDISCDLTELAKTPVAVVCSGAKLILDIPKTLEYLETQGVPIIGYRTNTFPLFYTTHSSYALNQQLDSVDETAQLIHLHFLLQNNGLIIANPIPQAASLDIKLVEQCIAQATENCQKKGIRGKAVTPYLLGQLTELTQGKTLKANQRLLIENAKVAGEIACAFQKIL